MSKTLQTRIQLKHDTEANWNTASINGFIPLVGEIIIYDPDDNNYYPRMKIGDGESLINDLPFSPISPERIDEFGNGYCIDAGSIQVWNEQSGTDLTPSGFYIYDNDTGRCNEVTDAHILLSDGSGNEIYITANGEMVTGDTYEGGKTLFIDNAIISGVADPYDNNDAVNKKYVDDENSLKMDKVNPTGTGSFSLNRTEDSDIGEYSFAEGYMTVASGIASHAEGNRTTASSESQHAQGKYNIVDENNTYAHIVGNGATEHARSNAHTLDWDGNGWFAGNVYIGSTSGTNKDDGSKKLATEEYVNNITPAFTVVGTTLIIGNTTSIPAAENYSF